MSNLAKELRERMELLPIGELRQQASKNFGIKLQKDYTKEDIVNLIVGAFSKHDFAHQAKGDLPEPGWARIKVQPMQGRNNFPFYLNCNGYTCFIPFNVAVDIPIKVLGTLNDAVETRYQSDGDANDTVSENVQSYVYSLISMTEGPDPRPGLEVGREKKLAAKRAFAELHGHWPKDSEIQAARQIDVFRGAFMNPSAAE